LNPITRKFSNIYNLPKAVWDAIEAIDEEYDVELTQDVISVTQLIEPPKIRQLYLRHKNEIEIDISERIWLLLGSSVHIILSKVKPENRLIEKRSYEEFKSITLTGKPDLYDREARTLFDFKVTSVWTVIFNSRFDSYTAQLNTYDYLFRKLSLPIKKLKVICFLRDWQYSQKETKDYPSIPIAIIQVPRWTRSQQRQFIKERLKLHKEAAKLPDDSIPICDTEERWYNERKQRDIRCADYCIVKKFCNYGRRKYEDYPGSKRLFKIL